MTHWPIFVEFAALSLTVGISGYFLSLYGDVIAEKTGLGGTWVGPAMIATVTSLPELVTGINAVTYVGVPDIATDDLAYLDGPLLANISATHLVTAQSAIMMTGIAIVGLFYRPATRLFKTVGWTSLFMFSIYILNMSVLYLQRD